MNISRSLSRRLPKGRHFVIGVPFLWLFLFFLLPFIIVLKISFAEAAVAIPPYTDVYTWVEGKLSVVINLGNYIFLSEDDLYLSAYLGSLKMALVSTLLCLLIGYPMAYAIARLPATSRNVALMLVILPSWISFLIRIYAWMGILQTNGLLNRALLGMGIVDEPLRLLNTPLAAYIGIVYAYLPFMILPLYATLVKMDLRLLEAAYDLGARPWKAFLRITLPLSRSGIIAGCMLVMIPAVGEFVIPELLGGPDTLMIGRLLWSQFFNAGNWPMASAVAIVMLGLLLVPILVFHRFQQRELEGRLT